VSSFHIGHAGTCVSSYQSPPSLCHIESALRPSYVASRRLRNVSAHCCDIPSRSTALSTVPRHSALTIIKADVARMSRAVSEALAELAALEVICDAMKLAFSRQTEYDLISMLQPGDGVLDKGQRPRACPNAKMKQSDMKNDEIEDNEDAWEDLEDTIGQEPMLEVFQDATDHQHSGEHAIPDGAEDPDALFDEIETCSL
jgi:hypothetical protein